ncbi:MAG: hypothetical protein DWQ37_00400 [Planctomycetota bacterium]|nr:MAG: hypothetical protein DWQ37_00400 [Planctomycetota bacterium]
MNYLVRDWDQAVELYGRLSDLNPTVGLYWYRLGEALLRSKQYEQAIAPLKKAEELGSFQSTPPRMAHRGEVACLLATAFAALGEQEEARRWTRTALDQGLRDITKLRSAEFAELLEDPAFCKLVWQTDTQNLSRDEGYRHDLRFAVHELKRVHFSPFRATSEADIDAAVAKLEAEIPDLSEDEILTRFVAIISLFGDGHTRLQTATPQLPVRLFRFPEGLFVLGATSEHADLVGARILRINNCAAEVALARAESILPRENPMMPLWLSPSVLQSITMLRGLGIAPAEGAVGLQIEDASGQQRTVQLVAPDKPPWRGNLTYAVAGRDDSPPEYLRHLDKTMWHEVLPDGKTMYCQLNGIGHGTKTFQKYFEALFEEIEKGEIERLVLDMRFNGGGNTFLNPPLIEGLIRSEKFREPGNLFVITGRSTFSAAINTVGELERRTTAILVGEPPSSPPNFVGESVGVPLPCTGWEISISDLSWQTSFPMDYRVWISPTIYAPPTAETFRAHRDPALEAIFDYVRLNASPAG